MSPPAPNQVVCFFPDAVYFLPSLPPTVPVNLSISSCHFHSLPHPSLLSTLISLPILLPLSPNLPLPLWHLLLSAFLLFTVTPTTSTNNNLLLFPLYFFFIQSLHVLHFTFFYTLHIPSSQTPPSQTTFFLLHLLQVVVIYSVTKKLTSISSLSYGIFFSQFCVA